MERTVSREEGRIELDVDPVEEVHVEIVGGEVIVAGTPGPGHLEVECLSGPPLEVAWHDGALRVRHRPVARLNPRTPRALVTVSCAPHTSVRTLTVSAPTTVAGIAGSVRTTTVSAPVTWGFVSGELVAQTVSGRLEMEAVMGQLRINTVSGPVGVAGGRLDELSVLSTSGDVVVDLDSRSTGNYRLRTVSGGVAVALPTGTDLTVEASSVSGGIDLPAPSSGGRRRRRSILGSGQGHLRLDSVSGRLAVLTRDAVLA